MPHIYTLLNLPSNIDQKLALFIREVFDSKFEEAERLLFLQIPNSDQPPYNFGFSLGLLLLTIIDTAANLLIPTTLTGNKIIFTNFIKDYFPWDKVSENKPWWMDPKSLPKLLYESFRSPMVHTSGVKHKISRDQIFQMVMPFPGFASENLNNLLSSSPEFPFYYEYDNQNLIKIKLEIFYIVIKLAVQKILNQEERLRAIKDYILSGDWTPQQRTLRAQQNSENNKKSKQR